jgi:hypothetical protein
VDTSEDLLDSSPECLTLPTRRSDRRFTPFPLPVFALGVNDPKQDLG